MATPKTIKLMVDGELQEALVRIDKNGEFACKTTSGRIFFFPKDCDLKAEAKKHNAANSERPVFADEVEDTIDAEWENWGKESPESGDESAESEEAEDDA